MWENYWSAKNNHDWWKRPAPEVLDFINSISPRERPRVLVLGCGLGRHAIAFAQAGFTITAIDASATAISHLYDWAHSLKLSIETRVCNVLEECLPRDFFDVVLSYNVIYHGMRIKLMRSILHIYRLLKSKGLFYFTCPSRQDGKYGSGEMIAPHTYRCQKSVTPGDIHYFAEEKDWDE